MSSYHLVINKYNEDTHWLKYMNKYHLFVYDKSDTPLLESIPRPNIGREGETFIYHILKYYNDLPEYLITLQGNPFDHFNGDITPMNLQQQIEGMLKQRLRTSIPLFTRYQKEYLHQFPPLYMKQLFEMFNVHEDICYYASGAQLIIPRSCIVKKSYDFYEELYAKLLAGASCTYDEAHYGRQPGSESESDSNFSNQHINPWQFERLLLYLFR